MADVIIAACDGAASPNPGPAAWAWVVAGPDGAVARWEAGPLGKATNNIAELTALLRLLEATDPDVPLEVRMDSTYAMRAVTDWLPGWRRRGWKNAAGKPVANQELVRSIDDRLAGREVRLVHVRAHQVGGDPYNAAADAAAAEAARTQNPAGTAHGSPLPTAEDTPTRAPAPKRRAGGKPGGGTLKAKYPGRCRCGKPYAAGTTIAKNDAGWGHVECAGG
ncbi:ribonuclease HI [Streptomyces sp. WMMC500]|uniref:ribonuclease H family protein n=1 Tax=Streptomyces sp. WMMC500 TaxID=3015154 RepID=UPI00248C04C4|nr:ribonuclease H [Streptomyces sp. WMMC500]WBB57704.1 ribonuclease HI [Streptomyces sp. WMMC500]